jgi:predicted DNA binding CopG/RHH family protein
MKETKSIIVYVRLTPTQLALIKEKCARDGVNISTFLRNAALNAATIKK